LDVFQNNIEKCINCSSGKLYPKDFTQIVINDNVYISMKQIAIYHKTSNIVIWHSQKYFGAFFTSRGMRFVRYLVSKLATLSPLQEKSSSLLDRVK
jgi:hypothetical protein